jgi:hypothetical protein
MDVATFARGLRAIRPMPPIPRVGQDAPMDFVDHSGHPSSPRATTERRLVVVPEARRDPDCQFGCRSPYLCGRCREDARGEALRWLRALADDYFGYDILDAFGNPQGSPELQVLWRDPFGIARLGDEPSPPRGL